MTPADYEALDPGIRQVVRWLNDNHFETTDSGDGVTKPAAGWGDEALDFPHVFIHCEHPMSMIVEANRLLDILVSRGIERKPNLVEASYDPASGMALIGLYGVNDEMFAAAVPIPEAPRRHAMPVPVATTHEGDGKNPKDHRGDHDCG